MAGFHYGTCSANLAKFKPSLRLTNLRRQRRQSQDTQIRKQLTFTTQKLQKQELGTWKLSRTVQFVASPHHWRFLRELIRKSFGRTVVDHPSANECATYLSDIFSGNTVQINRPNDLTELKWTLGEVQFAVAKLKPNKAADGCGLVAELLKHAPPEFLMVMVDLFKHVLFHGDATVTWRKTFSPMLPKKHRTILTTDFGPIANIRLLYKTFAYMILHRIEAVLEMEQPEEQNGFRAGWRVEVITAKLILDEKQKIEFANMDC